MKEYIEFLKDKMAISQQTGFDIEKSELTESLYPHVKDVVFDPFGGIGTVPYCAIRMGRYGLSTELNYDYWKDGLTYLREAEMDATAPTLFNLLKVG